MRPVARLGYSETNETAATVEIAAAVRGSRLTKTTGAAIAMDIR